MTMRLNLFLPYRRRSKARRALGLLGPTWAAAPVRRGVQTLCLALFVVILLVVCWPYGSRHHAEAMAAREVVEAEVFLAADPLAGLSASLAARTVVWSLAWAGVVMAICLVFTRGFCGYVCPLGTLIDLFDWAVGRRVMRGKALRNGWWSNLKYALLAAVIVAAAGGTMIAGFVAAIPLLTRGVVTAAGPAQLGLARGWYLVPPLGAAGYVSIALFAAVFATSLLGPRFWCRCLCPTGALFSLANLLRLTDRRVGAACTGCGQCVKACPFDAIAPDFSTRPADCTFCQTCGGVCPVGAIAFGARRQLAAAPVAGAEPAAAVPMSRRAMLAATLAGGGAAVGAAAIGATRLTDPPKTPPVRPPGAVPEADFLRLCVRCGLCIKACPFNVLQPTPLGGGLDGLWTPRVAADWAGCDPTCTNCGQVCPTGAIRALGLEEKSVARMGLAVVDERTCLPHAGAGPCELCEAECTAAGYDAIEFIRVGVRTDAAGLPIPDTGYRAPLIIADKCVGCGLCQSRCRHINVEQKHLLKQSAIVVLAGAGHEDRLARGSYRDLRQMRRKDKQAQRDKQAPDDFFIP